MAFTPEQHRKSYRPLLTKAWKAHCRRECITETTPASKDEWTRAELMKCCKVRSTDEVDPKKGFEKVMAWFEVIAGDSCYWQLRQIRGDANRALFLLEETAHLLRLTDDYISTIMFQMRLEKPLRQCTADELLKLRIALLYHCRRQQDRAVEKPLQGGLPGP